MTEKECETKITDLKKRQDFFYDKDIALLIKLLEQKPCEDAISREDAIMCMTGEYAADMTYKPEDIISKHIRRLKALPPVQPKIKTGHWIIIDDCEKFIAKCSECGRIEDSRMIHNYPYCHCGAKMESETNQ